MALAARLASSPSSRLGRPESQWTMPDRQTPRVTSGRAGLVDPTFRRRERRRRRWWWWQWGRSLERPRRRIALNWWWCTAVPAGSVRARGRSCSGRGWLEAYRGGLGRRSGWFWVTGRLGHRTRGLGHGSVYVRPEVGSSNAKGSLRCGTRSVMSVATEHKLVRTNQPLGAVSSLLIQRTFQ